MLYAVMGLDLMLQGFVFKNIDELVSYINNEIPNIETNVWGLDKDHYMLLISNESSKGLYKITQNEKGELIIIEACMPIIHH